MNKIILIGHIGQDPTIENGRAQFNLAVNEKKNGEKKTTWFRCVKFKYVEFVEKYVRKGSQCMIVGKLDIYETEKNGQPMKYINVIIDEIELIGSGKKDDQTPVTDMIGQIPKSLVESIAVDNDTDDLPF